MPTTVQAGGGGVGTRAKTKQDGSAMAKQPNKCIDCGKVISESATRCRRCAIQAQLPARADRAKKQWQDPERRRRVIAKISEGQKKSWESQERRREMSEAAKKRWADPEYRRRMSAKISEGIKKRWQDPEYRRRMGARMSEASKRRWADPEYHRRTSAKISEGVRKLSITHKSAPGGPSTKV